jgi:polyphosphate kinase
VLNEKLSFGLRRCTGWCLAGQIIIHNLSRLFGGMNVFGTHTFRVTRNAELERHEEDADDLLDMISYELRERRFAPFVRLEVNPPFAFPSFFRPHSQQFAKPMRTSCPFSVRQRK